MVDIFCYLWCAV